MPIALNDAFGALLTLSLTGQNTFWDLKRRGTAALLFGRYVLIHPKYVVGIELALDLL